MPLGTLVINKAPLTVTAANKTQVYGDPAVAFTVAYSGFAGSEGPSVLGGTLVFTGSATTAVNAGSYVITPGGLTSSNYEIGFVDGQLIISKKGLRWSPTTTRSCMAAPVPALSGTLTGVVSGDNITASYLAGTGGIVTASTAVGLYPIIPLLADPDGKLTNYNLISTNGQLTITQAPLTVTADAKSRQFGSRQSGLHGHGLGLRAGSEPRDLRRDGCRYLQRRRSERGQFHAGGHIRHHARRRNSERAELHVPDGERRELRQRDCWPSPRRPRQPSRQPSAPRIARPTRT